MIVINSYFNGKAAVRMKKAFNVIVFVFLAILFFSVDSNADDTESLVIDEMGNVGIGTTTPQSVLHISKDSDASATLGQAPAVIVLEQANNNNWLSGEAAAEIVFKKGNDIVGAIRSEHMSDSTLPNKDAGLSFYVTPIGETPTVFEAMRITESGYIGIGTIAPEGKMHIEGDNGKLIFSSTGAHLNLRTANPAWNHYPYLQLSNYGGTRGIYLGYGIPGDYVHLKLENGNDLFISGGNVGIGTSTPDYALDVNGTIRGTHIESSDLRLKEDVVSLGDTLGRITQLRGVKYRFKGFPERLVPEPRDDSLAEDMVNDADGKKGTAGSERENFGLIAQEVEKIFPEVVYTDEEGYKSIAYGQLVAPLIEAVKALETENNTLEQENEKMKQTIIEILARLDALEQK